jgi:TolB protein
MFYKSVARAILCAAIFGSAHAASPSFEVKVAGVGARPVAPPSQALDETAAPDLAPLRAASADALTVGSVQQLPGGRWRVRFRLWDVVSARDLGGQSYTVAASDLRLAAHRISDFIYKNMTGDPGIFSTRLAYVTRAAENYALWVSDADGLNARTALSSRAPIISPAWSVDGRKLAYVSFESRKPVVYVQDVATGQRRLIANFRGSNSAPAWAPDGKTLAVTLTRDGQSQLYVVPATGGAPRRLSQSPGIDTEPVYSADGRLIYFVSDRAGSPQIYRISAQGGEAQRVTSNGDYNISPAVSPDGRRLAYISRIGTDYRLHVMDLASGAVEAITATAHDEQPSFSPDGRLLVYATRIEDRETLMTTTLDGKTQMRLAVPHGDIREPGWGPLLQ